LDKTDLEPFRTHAIKRLKDRFVLDGRADHMHLANPFSMRCKSAYRDVIAFGSTAGEYNFVSFHSHHAANTIARLMYRTFGPLPMSVRTTRIAIKLPSRLKHRLQNTLFNRIRRVAIKI
jgi:hypothetical protein